MAFEFLTGKKHISCFVVTIKTPEGVFSRLVDDKSFTVGRSPECTLSFPDPNISRTHCVITYKSDQIFVIDQASSNGTFVNGERVLAQKMTALKPTDLIKIGISEIYLKVETIEKVLKVEELAKSLLPDHEKNKLLALIEGAQQSAHRMMQQAQEHTDKVNKSLEQKAKLHETEMQQKLEAIVAEAHRQAELIKEGGQKECDSIVLSAEQKAIEASRNVFNDAENKKSEADKYYREKVEQSKKEADEVVAKSKATGQEHIAEAKVQYEKIVQQAKLDGEEIKKKIEKTAEDEKVELLDKTKRDFETTFQEILLKIENKKTELEQLEKDKLAEIEKKEKSLIADFEEKNKSLTANFDEKNKNLTEEFESKNKNLLMEFEDKNTKLSSEFNDKNQRLNLDFEEKNQKLTVEFEDKNRNLVTDFESKNKALATEFEDKNKSLTQIYQNKEADLNANFATLEQEIAQKKEKLNSEIDNLSQLYKNKEQDYLANHEKLMSEKEVFIKKLDADISENKTVLADFTSKVENKEKDWNDLNKRFNALLEKNQAEEVRFQQSIEKLQSNKNKIEEDIASLEQIRTLNHQKQKDLEQKLVQLQYQLKEHETKISDSNKEYELQKQQLKKNLENDIVQFKKERDESFKLQIQAENERVQKTKEQIWTELAAHQGQFVSHMLQSLSVVLLQSISQDQFRKVNTNLEKQLDQSVSQFLTNMSLNQQAGQLDLNEVKKKQKKQKMLWTSYGLAGGLAIMFAVNFANNFLHENSVHKILEREKQQKEADLQARRFEPEQELDVKESYTKSVIYTKNFVKAYSDSQYQNQWFKAARDYLYTKWRIQEETSIEVLAMAKTLVQSLEEKRKGIHPDFVKQNVEKMEELEKETLKKMEIILGTEVKLQAFKKFEKKFFDDAILKIEMSGAPVEESPARNLSSEPAIESHPAETTEPSPFSE